MILMESKDNQTIFNGICFKTTAQLFSGLNCWNTEILSLSLQSVQLSVPVDQIIQMGGIYRLNIPIEGARGIAMSIVVTEIHDNNFQAKWTQIDMDSFAILKRTIELNSNKRNVREDIKHFVSQGH